MSVNKFSLRCTGPCSPVQIIDAFGFFFLGFNEPKPFDQETGCGLCSGVVWLCGAHGEPSDFGCSNFDSTGCLRRVEEIMKDFSHPELRLFHLSPSDGHLKSICKQNQEQIEALM